MSSAVPGVVVLELLEQEPSVAFLPAPVFAPEPTVGRWVVVGDLHGSVSYTDQFS